METIEAEEPVVMANKAIATELPSCFFFGPLENRKALLSLYSSQPTASNLSSTKISPGLLYLFDAKKPGFYSSWAAERTIDGVSCRRQPQSTEIYAATWASNAVELVYIFKRCCSRPLGGALDIAVHSFERHGGSADDIPEIPVKYVGPNLRLPDEPPCDWQKIRRLVGNLFTVRRGNLHYIPNAGDVYIIEGVTNSPLDGYSPSNISLTRYIYFDRQAELTYVYYRSTPDIVEL